jgi:anti-sigma28 factor (negative regulator of flagellin synthesis)
LERDNSETPDLTALLTKLRTLQPGSPEREAYLDDLSKRIRRGEYHADPRRIASRLLDEALEKSQNEESGSAEFE